MSRKTVLKIVIDDMNKCGSLYSNRCEEYKCKCYDKNPLEFGIDCTKGSCEFFEEEDGIDYD